MILHMEISQNHLIYAEVLVFYELIQKDVFAYHFLKLDFKGIESVGVFKS